MSYFKTRMTEILGIEYPIMCGGLQNAANPELAVAISEAGGLGITNISMYPNLDDFRTTMKWMRAHTSKPLAVNISMIPNIDMGDKIRQYLTICGEEGINVIETSGKDPVEFIPLIHSYGMKIVHKVPMAKHALRAQKSGVDCVTVVGSEAAGHPSPDLIGTMVVANRAVELCSIPVLVGGGICNGRSLAAALALGAEGVVIGTRFLRWRCYGYAVRRQYGDCDQPSPQAMDCGPHGKGHHPVPKGHQKYDPCGTQCCCR